MRIALIADTHLSARSPECVANWHAARRAVQRLAPELTVLLGDITLDGQRHPEELAFAANLAAQWPTELRCVPGNHDMGDASGEAPLDPGLLRAYEAHFGPDHWVVAAGGWHLLGINAQLFGSETAQERAQWAWIEAEAGKAEASRRRTAVFLHRPVVRPEAGEQSRKGRYIAHAARERLMGGALRGTLGLVVSGHTHQYMDFKADGVRHLWMPSSAYVLPDEMQLRIGVKLVGLGLLDLGGTEPGFDLWCPDGMARQEVSALHVFREAQ